MPSQRIDTPLAWQYQSSAALMTPNDNFCRLRDGLLSDQSCKRMQASRGISELFFKTSSPQSIKKLLPKLHPDKGFTGDSSYLQVAQRLRTVLDPRKEADRTSFQELEHYVRYELFTQIDTHAYIPIHIEPPCTSPHACCRMYHTHHTPQATHCSLSPRSGRSLQWQPRRTW